jgi:hypothetical protein
LDWEVELPAAVVVMKRAPFAVHSIGQTCQAQLANQRLIARSGWAGLAPLPTNRMVPVPRLRAALGLAAEAAQRADRNRKAVSARIQQAPSARSHPDSRKACPLRDRPNGTNLRRAASPEELLREQARLDQVGQSRWRTERE